MPPWNHLHPALVHAPLVLLPVGPVLVLVGHLWTGQRKGIQAMALLLMALGLGGAGLAVATGWAAKRFAERTPELQAAVALHADLALQATVLFGILTLGLFALRLLAAVRRRELPRLADRLFLILWLGLAGWSVTTLVRVGELGGRMVHVLHTHAGPEPPEPPSAGD